MKRNLKRISGFILMNAALASISHVGAAGGGTISPSQDYQGMYNSINSTIDSSLSSSVLASDGATIKKGHNSVIVAAGNSTMDLTNGGEYSAIVGGIEQKNYGSNSVIIGGSGNTTGSLNTPRVSTNLAIYSSVQSKILGGTNSFIIGGTGNEITERMDSFTNGIVASSSSTIDGHNSVILGGQNTTVTGNHSLSIGKSAKVTGNDSLAVGSNSEVMGNSGLALAGGKVLVNQGIAIGENAKVEHVGAIAIGAGAQTKETDQSANQYRLGDKDLVFTSNDKNHGISLGSDAETRTLQNVSAGKISDTSTDAVNGSQLHAVATTPITFAVDTGNPIEKTIGTTLSITGGATNNFADDNIGVISEGNNLKVKLSQDLKGIASIAAEGGTLNFKGAVLTAVGPGVNDSDAVTMGQFKPVETLAKANATEIGTIKGEMQTINLDLKDMTTKVDLFSKKASDNEVNINKMDAKITDLEKFAADTKKESAEALAKATDNETNIANLGKTVGDVGKMATEAKQEAAGALAKSLDNENNIANLGKTVGDVEKTATEAKQEAAGALAKALDNETNIAKLGNATEAIKDVANLAKKTADAANTVAEKANVAATDAHTMATENKAALDKKANSDASNINVQDWKDKLGIGNLDEQAIEELKTDIGRVGAHSAALAALKPLQYDPGQKTQIMASVGRYKNQNAYALGVAIHANRNFMINSGISLGKGSSPMVNAGVSWRVGTQEKSSMAMQDYAMNNAMQMKEMEALQQQLANVMKDNTDLQMENTKLRQDVETLKMQMMQVLAKMA